VLSAWCVALLEARIRLFGSERYGFLISNLVLAWCPLVFAVALRRSRNVLVAGAWLLFLPNAPYVLTDFIHLGREHRLYDTVLVGSFAVTGLLLGFASLAIVQGLVTRARGAVAGWAVAVGALVVSSIGIYLGRVHRVSSLDAIERPRRLLVVARVTFADPFGTPHLLVFVSALAGLLVAAYVAATTLPSLGGGDRASAGRRR
jgi:uncharacterized membrane protein